MRPTFRTCMAMSPTTSKRTSACQAASGQPTRLNELRALCQVDTTVPPSQSCALLALWAVRCSGFRCVSGAEHVLEKTRHSVSER